MVLTRHAEVLPLDFAAFTGATDFDYKRGALLAISTPTTPPTTTPTATPQPTETPTGTYSPGPSPTPFGGCVESVSPRKVDLCSEGGRACFNITAPETCCWKANLTYGTNFPSGPPTSSTDSGCGSGSICYYVPRHLFDPGFYAVYQYVIGSTPFLILQVGPETFYGLCTATPSPTAPTPTPTPSATRTPTRALVLTLTEFSTAVGAFPTGITTGQDGNLWFTEGPLDRIGRFSPATNEITEFPLPTAGSRPVDITAGSDGNLWFVEYRGNRVGRITPDSPNVITEYAIPTGSSFPSRITAGPDGNLWFTESVGNRIGRVLIGNAPRIDEFAVPTTAAGLFDITAGPDGNLWFTESGRGGQIGWLNPFNPYSITELSTLPGTPYGITTGPDGALWFTVSGFYSQTSGIGRIAPTTPGAISEYLIPSVHSDHSSAIVAGPDGNIWFIAADQIGRVVPASFPSDIALHPIVSRGLLWGHYQMTVGPDGNIWFTAADDDKIVRITLPVVSDSK
jgi:virginiamycin B lyase